MLCADRNNPLECLVDCTSQTVKSSFLYLYHSVN